MLTVVRKFPLAITVVASAKMSAKNVIAVKATLASVPIICLYSVYLFPYLHTYELLINNKTVKQYELFLEQQIREFLFVSFLALPDSGILCLWNVFFRSMI